MGVREVKPIFEDSVESIGQRDFMVLPTSGNQAQPSRNDVTHIWINANPVIRVPRSLG